MSGSEEAATRFLSRASGATRTDRYHTLSKSVRENLLLFKCHRRSYCPFSGKVVAFMQNILRRATATCGAFSIRLPTRQSRLKELSFKLSIVVWYRASDINKLSGLLRIGSAFSSGRSSTREFVTKNAARRLPNNPSNAALPR